MKKTVQDLKIRIDQLVAKDPVGNAHIIAKLKRKVCAMGNTNM